MLFMKYHVILVEITGSEIGGENPTRCQGSKGAIVFLYDIKGLLSIWCKSIARNNSRPVYRVKERGRKI